MLILEKPYVSETLVRTAIEKQLPVLRNTMSEKLVAEGKKLNLYNDNEFIDEYQKRHRIYTMSENALGWIVEKLPDEEMLKKIELLKNKATFRRICQDMYPDFFFCEEDIDRLDSINADQLQFPLVLKPSIGFLSAGVYVVRDVAEWNNAIADIKVNFRKVGEQFPEFVVGTHKYLIEEYIHGEEYAVDVYFDEVGTPVILNIYHHRSANQADTSHRLYCSSRALYDQYEVPFMNFMKETNKVLKLHDFPIHIEFRYDGKKAIPIEINPLRFAGFCLNELQTHISGIHPIVAYLDNIHLTKEEMWKGKEKDTYSFLVLERPAQASKEMVFNSEKFRSTFMDVLELRPLADPTVGVAATAFIRTDKAHEAELDYILNMDMMEFMMY
ncbi:MAG: ATP-grasp domain-containing protein [Bacteroidales bacterium]|nr:ATP-grasp domain-containing protein [Bacteroidales bacterium]